MKIYTDADRIAILKQIASLRDGGSSLKAACKETGITDATYYNWNVRYGHSLENKDSQDIEQEYETEHEERFPVKQRPASKISEEDQDLVLEIKASFPHMGVKQLRQHLIRNHKITYSERQIRQLLEDRDVPKIRAAHDKKPLRRFERDQPNEMWQIDIMQLYVGHQALYLISFLDDYSRFIISYTVSEHQKSEVVLELLQRAVSFRKPLCILTDRGVQFCSWNGVTAFQLKLNALGIDHLQASEQHP